MRRLALWIAAVGVAAAILAFEAGYREIGFAILAGMLVWSMISEINWVLSPKFWRETTTARFWVILVVVMLVGLATAKLR